MPVNFISQPGYRAAPVAKASSGNSDILSYIQEAFGFSFESLSAELLEELQFGSGDLMDGTTIPKRSFFSELLDVAKAHSTKGKVPPIKLASMFAKTGKLMRFRRDAITKHNLPAGDAMHLAILSNFENLTPETYVSAVASTKDAIRQLSAPFQDMLSLMLA